MIPAAYLLLELANLLREEFHGTPALGADHVVVAAAIVLMFVASDAIVKSDFAGEPTFGEQFQRAIHSGVTDAAIFFLDEAVEFVGREVIASLEESAQDRVALSRLLQADTFKVAVKDVLRFADHLAGDGGLIVDAFLQHLWPSSESEYHPYNLKMKFVFVGCLEQVEYNQRFP
jgi:hypothetical protein